MQTDFTYLLHGTKLVEILPSHLSKQWYIYEFVCLLFFNHRVRHPVVIHVKNDDINTVNYNYHEQCLLSSVQYVLAYL